MGQVTVTIGSRQYPVACDDGQEAHLTQLSRYLDFRAQELTQGLGTVSEAMLMVMVGLLLADELAEAYGELDELRSAAGLPPAGARQEAEESVAGAIDSLADRIEALAVRIGQS